MGVRYLLKSFHEIESIKTLEYQTLFSLSRGINSSNHREVGATFRKPVIGFPVRPKITIEDYHLESENRRYRRSACEDNSQSHFLVSFAIVKFSKRAVSDELTRQRAVRRKIGVVPAKSFMSDRSTIQHPTLLHLPLNQIQRCSRICRTIVSGIKDIILNEYSEFFSRPMKR